MSTGMSNGSKIMKELGNAWVFGYVCVVLDGFEWSKLSVPKYFILANYTPVL